MISNVADRARPDRKPQERLGGRGTGKHRRRCGRDVARLAAGGKGVRTGSDRAVSHGQRGPRNAVPLPACAPQNVRNLTQASVPVEAGPIETSTDLLVPAVNAQRRKIAQMEQTTMIPL